MIKTNKLTRIAAVATVGLGLALPAAASAADRKTQNAVIGGLVGALAGGLIGGDATGAIVGAGAGALLGAATTSNRRGYSYGGYRQPAYGYGRGYGRNAYQPSYGYAGYRQPAYGYGQSAYRYYGR